jgi:hypothetical protein
MAMGMMELVRNAREKLSALTGLPISSTLSIRKDEGFWNLQVEVVEKRSMPESQDILAVYEMTMDEEGNVMNFARVGMRRRGDVMVAANAEAEA